MIVYTSATFVLLPGTPDNVIKNCLEKKVPWNSSTMSILTLYYRNKYLGGDIKTLMLILSVLVHLCKEIAFSMKRLMFGSSRHHVIISLIGVMSTGQNIAGGEKYLFRGFTQNSEVL